MLLSMKLLDLFCGAGGAGYGYYLAGFQVTGVDLSPQPRYPFRFVQGDALEYAQLHGHEYDVIHASPPCQRWTGPITGTYKGRYDHPDLIAPCRSILQSLNRPYVIENVPTAPVKGITLCGASFGLTTYRHRRFESNMMLLQPAHLKHRTKTAPQGTKREGLFQTITGHMSDRRGAAKMLGVFWCETDKEVAQAIPPAYTEYIGRQLR